MAEPVDPVPPKVVEEARDIYDPDDPLHHGAVDDGTGHCARCGKVVSTAVVHRWPLEG